MTRAGEQPKAFVFLLLLKNLRQVQKKKNERHVNVFDRGYKLNLVAGRRHAQRCLCVSALHDLKGEKKKLPVKGSDSWKQPLRVLLMCV